MSTAASIGGAQKVSRCVSRAQNHDSLWIHCVTSLSRMGVPSMHGVPSMGDARNLLPRMRGAGRCRLFFRLQGRQLLELLDHLVPPRRPNREHLLEVLVPVLAAEATLVVLLGIVAVDLQ